MKWPQKAGKGMDWNLRPTQMALVSRTKLWGPGQHFGVLVIDWAGRAFVVDLQPDVGMRAVSVEDFRHGRATVLHSTLTNPRGLTRAWRRLQGLSSRPGGFDLLRWNCEHFGRFVLWGTRESRQVKGLTVTAAVVALVWLLGGLK